MSTPELLALNQRYIRLTDRCRSQWTFYQLLQGAFKHLRDTPCPLTVDYPAMFARFRSLADELSHPETSRVEQAMDELEGELDSYAASLREADREMPPPMLRRFFDSLRRQDEKVILAIIKYYLDGQELDDDTTDKLDILFTRLVELPREGGGSVLRERHEIENMVRPLLAPLDLPAIGEHEVDGVLGELADLRAEVAAVVTFQELAAGGALDRLRAIKRRLGSTFIDPALLPALLETTVAIKNRFGELWEDEEQQILSDTNRVMMARRLLDGHPEMLTTQLRDLFDTLAAAQQKVERGRQEEKIRREDILSLRHTLDTILEQCDTLPSPDEASKPLDDLRGTLEPGIAHGVEAVSRAADPETLVRELESAAVEPPAPSGTADDLVIEGLGGTDPLIHEYLSRIVFAFELVGAERPPAEIAAAKEVASMRLGAWEVEAIQRVTSGRSPEDTIGGQRDRLTAQSTALRIRLDEEAREIQRLRTRGSSRLDELLDRATHSLQRAAEIERRFQWFIDDALYRGATESLEDMFRSRMRLLRAYSGLWLIHNDSGGVSPY